MRPTIAGTGSSTPTRPEVGRASRDVDAQLGEETFCQHGGVKGPIVVVGERGGVDKSVHQGYRTTPARWS
jgi:hypothetical protein